MFNWFKKKKVGFQIPERYDDGGYFQLIVDTAYKHKMLRNQLAYTLATAKHETNKTFLPVKEAYWLSENWRKENLRYYPWYGRGFVQLTWEVNYKKASNKLGVDLISNPKKAMDPEVSAEILIVGMLEGWFTGKKIGDYVSLSKSDFINARRVINGTDKAELIAKYAVYYDNMLKTIGYGEE